MSSRVETWPNQFDDLFRLADWCRFLPKDVAAGCEAEANARSAKILEELAITPKPPSNEALDYALDKLQCFEEQCFNADMTFGVSISLSLWRLLALCKEGAEKPPYSYAIRTALARHLKTWLQRVKAEHTAPAWLENEHKTLEVEQWAKLTSELDARLLIRMAVKEMTASSRKDIGSPDGERTALVSDVMDLLATFRYFISPQAIASILDELSSSLDSRYGFTMVFGRLIIVLTPGWHAAETVKSERFWTWWSAIPEGLVPKFDLMWFAILARFAKQDWMGKGDAEGKAVVKKQLPWILNKIFRTLHLPLCSPAAGALDNAKEMRAVPSLDRYAIPSEIDGHVMGRKTNWAKVAKFIVYTLEAEPPTIADSEKSAGDADVNLDSAWTWLALYIRQLTPFLQPGGAQGEWHFHCFTLIQQLAKHYIKRSGRERLLKTKVPADRCLSRKADERFVELILPVINNCMQMDNPMVIIASLEVFAQLSQISAAYSPAFEMGGEPDPFNVDVPTVFGRALEFLNDPEQSGKHAGLFQVFGRAMPSILLRWPALVNDVLAVVLWGIDVTDLPKTLSSLTLITVLFTQMPCVDISDYPSVSSKMDAMRKRWPVAGEPDSTCDDDSAAQIVASMLPSFAADFFARMQEFIINLPKGGGKGGGFLDQIEDKAVKLMHTAIHLVAAQCSQQMYQQLLDGLKRFATTNLLVDQTKAAAGMTAAIVRVDPAVAVPFLLPSLLAKLSSKSTKGVLKDDISESEAKWYLALVTAAVRHGGEALLPFRADLESVLKGALADEHDDVVKAGAKLLRRILTAVTSTYIQSDFRICSDEAWKKLTTSKSAETAWALKWWGWSAPWWQNEAPTVKWHEPSDAEVEWARDLAMGVLDQVTKVLPSSVKAPDMSASAKWLDGLKAPEKKRASHNVKLGLMLIRDTLRGVCGLWLDERSEEDLRKSLLPKLSKHEGDMGRILFESFATVLINTAKALSAEECSAVGPASEALPSGIDQIEIAGLLTKNVFECMVVLLRSPGHANDASGRILSAGLRGASGNGLISMFRLDHSVMELIHSETESRWRGCPRIWWVLTVCDLLDARHRSRSGEFKYAGWRKEVMELMAIFAMRASTASVRDSARGFIAAAIAFHDESDYQILHDHVLPALASETEAALKCASVPSEAVPKEELRLNNAIEGAARMVVPKAIMHIVWEKGVDHAAPVGLALAEAIYATTRTVGERAQDGTKQCEIKTSAVTCLVFATQQWIDHRSSQIWADVRPAEHTFTADRAVKVVEIVEKLLAVCGRSDCHWRAQVMITAIIMTLRSTLGDFDAGQGIEKVRAVWLLWAKWLLSCCEPKAVPALHSVGVHGLSLLMKTPAPLTPSQMEETGLFQMEAFNKLLEVVPKLHHGNLMGAGEGGDPTEHTVKSVTRNRAFCSWPHVWGAKKASSFSRHNVLFWQSYIVFMAKNKSGDFLNEMVSTAAKFLAEKPTAEQEYHAGLAEFFAGTFRALRRDSMKELAGRSWKSMHPWLKIELQMCSQDRLADWCSAVRFISSGIAQMLPRRFLRSTDSQADEVDTSFIVPLFNFAIDLEQAPSQDSVTKAFPSLQSRAGDDSAEVDQDNLKEGSSLLVYKKLRLTLTLIAEPRAVRIVDKDKDFIGALFESLRVGLGHPYKQLREESARSVVFLLKAIVRSAPEISEPIKAWIASEAERLLPLLRADTEAGLTEARGGAEGRKPHVLQSSGICYVLVHTALERMSPVLLDGVVPRCLAFLLAAATHGDFELRVLAASALATCSVAHLRSPVRQGEISWHSHDLTSKLVEIARVKESNSALTYKELDKAIFMAARPMLLSNACMLRSQAPTNGTESLLVALRSVIEEGLGHSQPEVRNAAKGTLTSLMIGDTSATSLSYLKRCRQLAPRPKKGAKMQESSKEVLAGVVGLSCALSVVADLGAPSWVGQVIEGICPYGRSGIPDNIRNEVQGTIQSFLKMQQSRQQSWKEFQEKLTSNQLEMLNDYKGKLAYFS